MGHRREILCTVIVLSILVSGYVFEETILPAVESQLSTTIQITALTTGGDTTFDYTVTGPTSYNSSVTTHHIDDFTGDVVVYHSFDQSQLIHENANLNDFYTNAGSFGHNADLFGLDKNLHADVEHIQPGILGDGAIEPTNERTTILGNWKNEDQWNFLVDDQTQRYSINFWVQRLGELDSLNQFDAGVPILGTIPIGTSGTGLFNAFNLWIDEDSKVRVDIIADSTKPLSMIGEAIDSDPHSVPDSWTMVTFVIDKSGSATIYINGSNSVTEQTEIEGTFTSLTGSAGGVDYIDAPLSIMPNQQVQFPNPPYEPVNVEFNIDDLCIVKDYIFSDDDLEALYNNGQGMPCVNVTNSGTSTVEVPYLTQYDKLGSGSLEAFGIDSTSPHDFAIGHIPQINYGSQTIKNMRLFISGSSSTTGTLKAVVLSNITHTDFVGQGATKQNGDEVVEAESDSMDFSDPKFIGSDYFVTFNFTDTEIDLNSVDNFIGLNGTDITPLRSLTFQIFTGPSTNGGESPICMDYSNSSALWDNCNDYAPNILGGGTGIMYEVNVEAFDVSNGMIDSINFIGDGGNNGIGIEDVPTPVDPGIYSIEEIIPAGWNLSSASCNDGSSSFSGDIVSDISIDSGDNIECSFTNEVVPPGTLTIFKLTIGGDGTFDYTVTGLTSYNPSIVTTGGIGMDGPNQVYPGTYSIQESIPSSWNLTSASCNDGSSSFSVDTVSGIVVGSDDNIECSFTNELVPPGTLKITKLTTGGDDTFDYTVTGPTSYDPSITTSGGSVSMTAPNYGTLGASADAFYEEDGLDTSFNIDNTGLIGKSVLQEGMSSLHDNGTIRFGSDADKDQWKFIWDSTVPVISMNFWLKGDIDGNPEYQIFSTNPNDSGLFNLFRMYSQTTGSGGSEPEIIYIIKDDAASSALQGIFVDHIPADDGQWHMMTFLIDKNNATNSATLCIDATDCKTSGINGLVGSAGSPQSALRYGFDKVLNTNNDFQLDDFTIWTGYQLTSSDIASLYNSGSGTSAGASGASISLANQVGHWTFDALSDGSGGIGMDGPNQVEPGTYSIQESIPSSWNLTSATCNDGSSSFSVDTVSGIVVGSDDNIECTFENEFVGSADTDGDGIFDDVDSLPNTVSDDFSDIALGGTSSGTITARGNQTLTITEEPNPDGLRIAADVSGGLVPAVANVCGGISIITLSPEDNIVVTCGSVTIDVINGPVEVIFIGPEGTQATSSLTAGNSITFDQDNFSFSAPSTNEDPVVVIVDGEQIILNPSQAVNVLLSNYDSFIKQGELNTNEGANTMMRVRDDGNNRALVSFDQNEILAAAQERTLSSATLRLYIEENGNNWGSNGRTIDVHRLSASWAEGNGFNDKPASMAQSQFNALKTRGTGNGITWKCATDTNINNQQTNCAQQWNGATFNLTPTDTITIFKDNPPTHTVKTVGWIEFDVTSDLQAFLSNTAQNYGWIVKKTQEGATGLVEFTSREGSANNPELVLVFD